MIQLHCDYCGGVIETGKPTARIRLFETENIKSLKKVFFYCLPCTANINLHDELEKYNAIEILTIPAPDYNKNQIGG